MEAAASQLPASRAALGRNQPMLSTGLYQALAALLGALFVVYGMDVRRKSGARNFVAPAWQRLHKLSALVLIGGLAWAVALRHPPGLCGVVQGGDGDPRGAPARGSLRRRLSPLPLGGTVSHSLVASPGE